MATKNNITGDLIKSKPSSKLYRDNFDAIFNQPKVTEDGTGKEETRQAKDSSDQTSSN